jgi:hypothetical protein
MRIQGTVAVPLGGTSGNVLSGLVGSIVRDPSAVDLFAVADVTTGVISATFMIDSEAVLINGGISASVGTGIGPTDPENVIVRNEAAPPGSILSLTFFNSGGANVNVRYAVNVTPL